MSLTFTLENVVTIFTGIYTAINIVRAGYSIYQNRLLELDNVIRDSVQFTWENFVREKKQKNVWNNLAKIKATNLAVDYVEQRISLRCLCNRTRLRRLIIEQVDTRKYGKTYKTYALNTLPKLPSPLKANISNIATNSISNTLVIV